MNEPLVCILDYGAGNVRSVYNVFKHLGYNVIISNSEEILREASHIVLPGVGSFGSAMKKINDNLPVDVLEVEVIRNQKPFLGICVGMQILADVGYEFEKCLGLGWIPGTVKKLNAPGLVVPHVGWNDISIHRDHPIFQNLKDYRDLYFVHSFCFEVKYSQHALASAYYGEQFSSVVCRDNIMGLQFHPEKSQRAGQQILNNFVRNL